MTLDLNKLPRPVKDAKYCDIPDPKRPAPLMNLFRTKRCRGWWAITRKDEDGDDELVVNLNNVFNKLINMETKL